MGSEVKQPTCDNWDCNASLYFLQNSCHKCGGIQNWGDLLQIECSNCGRLVNSDHWSCYCGSPVSIWTAIVQKTLEYSPHTDLAVTKENVPHPSDWKFIEGGGKPVGQDSNYRVGLSDGRGIHVKEFEDHYQVHWDKVDPDQNPVGHLISDVPGETIAVAGFLYLLFGED